MSVKDSFSPEEWKSVAQSPFYVSAAIGMSDPGGPFGLMKEGWALSREVKEAMDGKHGELAMEVASEIRSHRPTRRDLIGDATNPEEAQAHAMRALTAMAALVQKAGPDAAPFLHWLNSSAQAIAEAGREGGFLGFGGESVSAEEKVALGKVRVALGQ